MRHCQEQASGLKPEGNMGYPFFFFGQSSACYLINVLAQLRLFVHQFLVSPCDDIKQRHQPLRHIGVDIL